MEHMGSTGRDNEKTCVFSHITLVLGTKPGNPVKLNMFKHKTTEVHFHPYLPFHLLLLLMKVSYYTELKDSRREDHNPVHLPTSLRHWSTKSGACAGDLCILSSQVPYVSQCFQDKVLSPFRSILSSSSQSYLPKRNSLLSICNSWEEALSLVLHRFFIQRLHSRTAHSQIATRKDQIIQSSGVYAKNL